MNPSHGSKEGVVGVDLGGTHLRVAVVSPEGEVSGRQLVGTPREAPHPDLLVELLRETAAKAGCQRAVVGIPGPVDYRHGRLRWGPNLPEGWQAALAEKSLSEASGLEVSVANDADLAAVGEAYFGAGRGADGIAYLTVSTGVGAGVVLGGRLVHGRWSLAEVGHTVIDRIAFREGRPSTFELLASGTAMARLAAERGLAVDGAQLRRLAEQERTAAQIWDEVLFAACIGLRNLVVVFAPSRVVVGGGVGLSEGFVDELAGRLPDLLPPGYRDEPPEVLAAELGDDAGLSGAGAWQRAFNPAMAGRR
jgi:predicted NBD/HSP70 family sugar kinase